MSRILFAGKWQLDDIANEQTIICRQLFAGQVVGFRPMKKKKIAPNDNNKWINDYLVNKYYKNQLRYPLNSIVIYLSHSTVHLLSNWGQGFKLWLTSCFDSLRLLVQIYKKEIQTINMQLERPGNNKDINTSKLFHFTLCYVLEWYFCLCLFIKYTSKLRAWWRNLKEIVF